MSKDSEKQRNQGFAHRHSGDRTHRFATEGFDPSLPAERIPLREAQSMAARNRRAILNQKPQPIRQG